MRHRNLIRFCHQELADNIPKAPLVLADPLNRANAKSFRTCHHRRLDWFSYFV